MADNTADNATLVGFLEALGSSAPTPGGGAASALVGALAAALAEMVAQLTTGRPKYAAVEGRVREAIEQLRAARSGLLQLMEEDEQAFQRVSAAYKLPKSDDDERARRDGAIQNALQEAMRPPLAIMTTVCEVLAGAEEIARIGNGTVASDAGCAALLGEAAVRSAALNVLANVVLLHDASMAGDARQRVADHEARAADLCQRTMMTVRQRMGLEQ
ncbi:MAG: cyclodeaminase/cyclohydrolase family protein [Nitrososphaerota archaeon]